VDHLSDRCGDAPVRGESDRVPGRGGDGKGRGARGASSASPVDPTDDAIITEDRGGPIRARRFVVAA
jgi:hypothetical protein